MFTTPQINLASSLEHRSYVFFFYNGKRYREYNGKRLNLKINPNQSKTSKDKLRLLNVLQFEFKKALESGWNPEHIETEKPSLKKAFDVILDEKLNSNLSDAYNRTLIGTHKMFLAHLPKSCLNSKIDELPLYEVEAFLSKFRTSERNYINRRRLLGTFFREAIRKEFATRNFILQTPTARPKANLHIPYSKEEINTCLEFLKINYPKLHLCCLLTYGCLLRPHQEIRILKLKHFANDFTEIRLSGSENKSKRVRTVYIPHYLQSILAERFKGVHDKEVNIFSLDHNVFNVGYFNLMWGKAKVKMLKAGIIQPNHTIYSFRHTAAVNVYRKTKDLHILQQLLQHSNMIVTLNYLRGLGEINDERLRDVLPEL